MPVSAFIIAVDCRTKRIPNWTCLFVFVSGLFLEFVFRGWTGLGAALIGGLLGFVAFLIPYLRGGMGGGDVKLMAAFGALLGGWKPTFIAILVTGIVGGVLASLYLLYKAASRSKPEDSLPYGPAICIGSIIALIFEASNS